jgi:hypothetical protein
MNKLYATRGNFNLQLFGVEGRTRFPIAIKIGNRKNITATVIRLNKQQAMRVHDALHQFFYGFKY